MNAEEILSEVIESVRDACNRVSLGTAIEECVDDYVDRNATAADCLAILDAFGDVDLSEPGPDLAEGWPRVLRQLAYTALAVKVRTETRGWPAAEVE